MKKEIIFHFWSLKQETRASVWSQVSVVKTSDPIPHRKKGKRNFLFFCAVGFFVFVSLNLLVKLFFLQKNDDSIRGKRCSAVRTGLMALVNSGQESVQFTLRKSVIHVLLAAMDWLFLVSIEDLVAVNGNQTLKRYQFLFFESDIQTFA